MFFIVAKLYEGFLSPVPLLLLLALAGAVLLLRGARRSGAALALGAPLALIAIALSPVGQMLVAPLEDRFPPPTSDAPPPDGIILLGGALKGDVSLTRGEAVFDEGERIVEGALLAKRYPAARVVFSGGNGSLDGGVAHDEADSVVTLLQDLGVDPARVTVEGRSRNSDENARFSAAVLHPEPGQRWLLVTSGFHMPRAMGLFEKAGFDIVAYPVGFRTLGPGRDIHWSLDPVDNLRTFEIAAKEWVGLLVYRATGRIDTLFPRPPERRPVLSGS